MDNEVRLLLICLVWWSSYDGRRARHRWLWSCSRSRIDHRTRRMRIADSDRARTPYLRHFTLAITGSRRTS